MLAFKLRRLQKFVLSVTIWLLTESTAGLTYAAAAVTSPAESAELVGLEVEVEVEVASPAELVGLEVAAELAATAVGVVLAEAEVLASAAELVEPVEPVETLPATVLA